MSATDTITPASPAYLSQAVILAGGRGTRLAPLTDTRPKPMIEFHGKPFLEYLVEQLAEQGITDIVMLLGYLPDCIVDHFGDGNRWGVRIRYSIGEVDDETGRRLQRAGDLFDDVFLLMYCDNLCPLNFQRMWSHFRQRGARAQVTVYANEDGYTRNNLIVDSDGFISVYDKSRTAEGLRGVDIGYLITEKSVLEILPEGNPSFEVEVYGRLVAERQLAAFVTRHRYYSVGDFRRIRLTEQFLERRPAVLLDRDGVLNEKAPRGCYVTCWDEWRWRDGAREALGRLHDEGYQVIVITNQAGIARGSLSEDDLAEIHRNMIGETEAARGSIAAIYHCPHHWDDGCECRKPKPGMIFQAQREFGLDLSRTFYIGDDDRDGKAAEAAECLFAQVGPERSLLDIVQEGELTRHANVSTA